MRPQVENLTYRALFRWESLKRTLPLWVLMLLFLALEGCKKKK